MLYVIEKLNREEKEWKIHKYCPTKDDIREEEENIKDDFVNNSYRLVVYQPIGYTTYN